MRRADQTRTIREAARNRDLCASSVHNPRTHPFNHVAPPGDDRQRRVEWMAKEMNEQIVPLQPSLYETRGFRYVTSMYMTREACEDVAARMVERNADAISEWLDACSRLAPTKDPQRLSFDTNGNMTLPRNDNDADRRAAQGLKTRLHRFSERELDDMPDDSIAFVVTSTNKTDDDGTRRPATAFVNAARHQGLTLQYDPESRYGFVVVTAYPLDKMVSHETPAKYRSPNETTAELRDAYLMTDFARQGDHANTARAYDNLSIAARLTPHMQTWFNVPYGIQIKTTLGPTKRFQVEEDAIQSDDYRTQGDPVSRSESTLRPLRPLLDRLYGTQSPSYPTRERPRQGHDAQALADAVRDENQDRQSGTYPIDRLGVYSYQRPLTLAMTNADEDERHAVVVRNDGVFMKPTVDSDVETRLTTSMLAKAAESPFARELRKFRQELSPLIRAGTRGARLSDLTGGPDSVDQAIWLWRRHDFGKESVRVQGPHTDDLERRRQAPDSPK